MMFGFTLQEIGTLIFAAMIPVAAILFVWPYLTKIMEGEEHERLKAEKEERDRIAQEDIQEYRAKAWDEATGGI